MPCTTAPTVVPQSLGKKPSPCAPPAIASQLSTRMVCAVTATAGSAHFIWRTSIHWNVGFGRRLPGKLLLRVEDPREQVGATELLQWIQVEADDIRTRSSPGYMPRPVGSGAAPGKKCELRVRKRRPVSGGVRLSAVNPRASASSG